MICGGYIIDAVITEDSRCQYEESIIYRAVQTFIVASFYGMAALPLAFMACNTSYMVGGGNSLSLDSIRRESNTEFPYAKILFMDIILTTRGGYCMYLVRAFQKPTLVVSGKIVGTVESLSPIIGISILIK